MAIELYKTFHWVFLGKVIVLAKLALLGLVPFTGEMRLPLLLGVAALASVGAHMPSRYWHCSILPRRVLTAQSAVR